MRLSTDWAESGVAQSANAVRLNRARRMVILLSGGRVKISGGHPSATAPGAHPPAPESGWPWDRHVVRSQRVLVGPRMSDSVHLSLVLPVLNGAERLALGLPCVAAWMQRQRQPVELVLVDDGSTPATRELLHGFADDTPNVSVLVNGRNHGKGHAVARGMLAAKGTFRVFLDADLAYPIEEAAHIVRHLEAGADVAVACRVL